MSKNWALADLLNPKMRAQAEAQLKSESAQQAQEAAEEVEPI